MSNLPKRAHPPWCLRGSDCATTPESPAWHSSRLLRVPAAEHSCVDIAVGRWQLDSAQLSQALAGGVLLEFRLGDDVDQWPVDRAQALALTGIIPRLLRGDAATPLRGDGATPYRWAA
ncbi:hypothetical protein O7632_06795 [Solwaraspora sp. WMMD406]|uniref:hypothetical protein n=1 Tax=unclassified Solwaraspora TaxID=2627926 RepID=UPI0024180229|nr:MULTISPECIES: hypothetical protein [unclassified Solwaraspora]MDG4763817.1 hypothetical protein [Solwaraspora sp. WMMD406]WJK42414.1 hypothetical protein O7608_08570 [Solwaraspora sp. WMMA2056]